MKEKLDKKLYPLSVLGAAGLILTAYWPAFKEIDFLWDDWAWVVCAQTWSEDPSTIFTLDPSFSFRPLCSFFFLIIHSITGINAFGHLVFSLFLHLLASMATGALAHKVTGEKAIGRLTLLVFCVLCSYNEALIWIGAYTHVLLGLLIFLFLNLTTSLVPVSTGKLTWARAGLVLLLLILTREPWVSVLVLVPIVIVWMGGFKALFSKKGMGFVISLAISVLIYMLVFSDIGSGDRVPGGEKIFSLGWDCAPRIANTFTHLFTPDIFYAAVLRNPLSGCLIALGLLILCWARGIKNLRQGIFALVFLVGALGPYSLYKSDFLSSRYLYVASFGAALLLICAVRGIQALVEKAVPSKPLGGLFFGGALLIYAVLCVLGTQYEIHHRYIPEWRQHRAVANEFQKAVSSAKNGKTWLGVVGLPTPNPAVWENRFKCLFPENKCSFLMCKSPDQFKKAILFRVKDPNKLLLMKWRKGSNASGRLEPMNPELGVEQMIKELTPEPMWGFPKHKAPIKYAMLLFKRE